MSSGLGRFIAGQNNSTVIFFVIGWGKFDPFMLISKLICRCFSWNNGSYGERRSSLSINVLCS